MRVIFSSPDVPVAFRDPRDGTTQDGQLRFELVLLEEGEDPTPPAARAALQQVGSPVPRLGAHSLRSLRQRAAGGLIEIPPPQDMTGGVPVVVPATVVDKLPDTAAFIVRWSFTARPQP
jgi:hypothetical protein